MRRDDDNVNDDDSMMMMKEGEGNDDEAIQAVFDEIVFGQRSASFLYYLSRVVNKTFNLAKHH